MDSAQDLKDREFFSGQSDKQKHQCQVKAQYNFKNLFKFKQIKSDVIVLCVHTQTCHKQKSKSNQSLILVMVTNYHLTLIYFVWSGFI